MRKNYNCLKGIKGLNICDKILLVAFKNYTYKIYSTGVKLGFNLNKEQK